MERLHSNSRVNQAGDFVSGKAEDWTSLFTLDRPEWDRMLDTSFDIVTDWRNIHGVPLKIVANTLSKRAFSVDIEAITAQRLKRFRSIRDKLRRSPANNLTTMQDIAGCRAVVGTLAQAYALRDLYFQPPLYQGAIVSEVVPKWCRDYIQNPKPDGYRSIHLVMKFNHSSEKFDHCKGLRVEVQIRSKMQHAWAMAVETASAVTNQALKSGIGEADWKRFFLLIGDLMADTEGSPLVCDSPIAEIREEASHLAQSLKVISMLENMQHVIETFSSFEGDDDMYLLELDSQQRKIIYTGFSQSAYQSAAERYSDRERETRENQDLQVVLVSVRSLEELKTAYPSFFLDSSGFIHLMRQQIFGHNLGMMKP